MMEDVIFMQIVSTKWWQRPDLPAICDNVYNRDIHAFISSDSSNLTGKFPPIYALNTILTL